MFRTDRPAGRRFTTIAAGVLAGIVAATPVVAGGRVYHGEGLHTDSDRRLFALDLGTGKPAWPNPFATTSHTEGTPRVVDGRIYLPAGDDGLHCVSAAEGTKVWHFRGFEQGLHIDTPPAVQNTST